MELNPIPAVFINTHHEVMENGMRHLRDSLIRFQIKEDKTKTRKQR